MACDCEQVLGGGGRSFVPARHLQIDFMQRPAAAAAAPTEGSGLLHT